MRLKSFYAKTMMEAMQQVRETLGDNAIIVASREEGGTVRLTAAIDEDTPASIALGFGTRQDFTPAPSAYDDLRDADRSEAEEGLIIERITDVLLRHGTPTDVMDSIISTATMVGLTSAEQALRDTLGHQFSYLPLPTGVNRKPIMLTGMPGSGKTLFITKLATRAVLAGRKPAIITTDTQRAGGVEQLSAFTKILKIPLLAPKNAAELRDALKTVKDAECVYIDTAGTNPFDVDDMRLVAQLAEAGPIEPVLIQAAGGDADEMAEIACCFAVLGVQRQVFSRLDISKKLGGLLASAQKAGLTFADYADSPMPSNGLKSLTANGLLTLLLGHAETQENKTIRKNNQNTANRGRTVNR